MADTTTPTPEVTPPATPTPETVATTPPVTEAATTTAAPTLKRGGSKAFFNRMAQEFDTQAKAPTGDLKPPSDPKRDIEAKKDTVEATPAPVSDKTANPVVAAVDAPVTKLATASDVEPQKTDAAEPEPEPDELTKTKAELATLKKEREDALEAANSLQLDRTLNEIAAKIAKKDQTYANLKTSFDEAAQKLDDDDPVLQRLDAAARTAWDESQELRQAWGQQKTYLDQQAQVKRKETITKGVTGLLQKFELDEAELKKADPKLDTVNNSLGTMEAALKAQQKKYEKRIAALETEAKSAAEKAEEAARKKWSQESPASQPPPIGGNGNSALADPAKGLKRGEARRNLDAYFTGQRK